MSRYLEVWTVRAPRTSRRSWRRHMPAWVGLARGGRYGRETVVGVYLRVGSRVVLAVYPPRVVAPKR